MEIVDLFAVEIYGDGSFYPGEIIYGDVYLKTNEELTLREIRIEFYGEAKVSIAHFGIKNVFWEHFWAKTSVELFKSFENCSKHEKGSH